MSQQLTSTAGSWAAGRAIPAARPVAMSRWVGALVAWDAVAALGAGLVALLARFGERPASFHGLSYMLVLLALPPVWLGMMAAAGTYRPSLLVTGSEEFRRVCNGGVWLLAGIALASFLLHSDVSREVVGISVPLATLLTLVGRYAARRGLHHQVRGGRPVHRVLVVGDAAEVGRLVRHMGRAPHVGFSVVGACVPDAAELVQLRGAAIPLTSTDEGIIAAVRRLGADTIAIAGSAGFRSLDLRRLSWDLEGTGIRLVVAPAVTDVAGPRIRVRPVDGLPLLHVEEPHFSGFQRVVKEAFDLVVAAVTTVVLLPLLLAIAILVKLTSRGPVLFRQTRIGVHGEQFHIWKFRTMTVGADGRRGELVHLNDHDGVLFKIRADPRVTRAGRWLRRFSLDELPQLWNVLAGAMSLVGPRPPLPSEVRRYESSVRRRLLVKPGMTGLWQISGRANLPWEEAVRLDLYYVEHWSLWLDLMVLWKTLGAVLRRSGAY